jgi:hypothetical protein
VIAFRKPSARATIYRSANFVRHVAGILQRDPRDVRLHVHTLLETGRVPIEMPDQEAAAAIGTEAARILCAVASRQIQSSSVARVTDRILAMNYQCDVRGHRGGGQASKPSGKRRGSYECDLSVALRETWEASERGSGALPMPPHFSVTWNENGSVL